MQKGILFVLFVLFLIPFGVASAQTSCLLYPSDSAPAPDYGVSWDVFDSAKRLLISASCTLNSEGKLKVTIGSGDTTQYVYKSMYSYKGPVDKWKIHPLVGGTVSGDWIMGSGVPYSATDGLVPPAGTSSSQPYYFVGYVCVNRGDAWKCGCRDAACNTRHWQLQAYIPPSSGGGTGGGTNPPSAGFPEIKECGTPQNVSPSNFSAAISGNGCKTLIMTPGTYPRVNIVNHSGGVLTLRCSEPGACTMGSASDITDSNGVIIDGVRVRGGGNAIWIDNSKNILIRRSTLLEQTGGGIVVTGENSENLQAYGNTFLNRVQDGDRVLDGLPVGDMDYGMRIYDTKSIDIQGNTFDGLFAHGISFKYGVDYAVVANNTFGDCGRHCVQLGQEPNSSTQGYRSVGHGVVKDNIFTADGDIRLTGIFVMNVEKATITGNTFDGRGTWLRLHEWVTGAKVEGIGATGVVVGKGYPSNRQVIQSNNTVR